MSREHFSSRSTAVLAMAGSAIGLGNIWRFPYMVGENGGAAFILVYLLATLLLSLPIFFSESIIGRATHQGTIGAMKALAPGTAWRHMGLLTVLSPLIILSFYSVVGGWSVEYLLKSLTFDFQGATQEDLGAAFGGFISSTWGPLVCHTVFLSLCALIILAGVKKGIEQFSKYTMPLLFVLIVVIMVYSLSLPGASEGVKYLLKPDFSRLKASSVAAAMGQSFFSLSLGVGTILTYSSYIRKEENLLSSGVGTAASDLGFALIAGFAVMPAVFAAGIAPGAGPGLLFETLPYIFSKIGTNLPWLSSLVAVLLFVTVLVAALTSAISMFEVGVTFLVEERGVKRSRATGLIFLGTWALGCLCSLSFGPLDGIRLFGKNIFGFCDALTANFLMTFGGLLFTLFVGWKMKKEQVRDEFTCGGQLRFSARIFPAVYFLIRWIAPAVILLIFVTNLLL